MIDKVNKKRLKIELYIFVLLCCLQNLSFIAIGDNFSLKFYHVFSLIFLPRIIKKQKVTLPNLKISFFLVYLIVLSLLLLPIYGFSSLMFNYIFCFYVLIIFLNCFKYLDKNDFLDVLKTVSCTVAFIIFIKLILNLNIIINFIKAPYGHPMISTIFGGGVNLEATWLTLLGFSFYKDKRGFIYWLFSLMISALYASRVGIIVAAVLFVFLLFQADFKQSKNRILKIFGVIFIGVVLICILSKYGLFNYVLKRFTMTGTDPGSLGRLAMWKYALQASENNIFGYGLGNTIKAIEMVSEISYFEDNIHNLFLQMLIDGGIFGFLYFTYLYLLCISKSIKDFFTNPFLAFVMTYLILSLAQFRGGDAIMFIFLGIYLLTIKKEKC